MLPDPPLSALVPFPGLGPQAPPPPPDPPSPPTPHLAPPSPPPSAVYVVPQITILESTPTAPADPPPPTVAGAFPHTAIF